MYHIKHYNIIYNMIHKIILILIYNIFHFIIYNKKYIKIYKIIHNIYYIKMHIYNIFYDTYYTKGDINMGYDVIMRGKNDTALIRVDGGDAIIYEVGYFGVKGDFNKYDEYMDDFEGAYKHFKSLGNNKQINIKNYYIYANAVFGTLYYNTLEELKSNALKDAQDLKEKMLIENMGNFYLAIGVEFEDQNGHYGGVDLINKKAPDSKFTWCEDYKMEGIDLPEDLKVAMQDLINTL